MLDVWFDEVRCEWFLGSNCPMHPVSLQFLMDRRVWCRARNGAALRQLMEIGRVHCFWFEDEFSMQYAITSRGFIWAGRDAANLGQKCVVVAPTVSAAIPPNRLVCSDDVMSLRLQRNAERTQRVAQTFYHKNFPSKLKSFSDASTRHPRSTHCF